MTNFHFRLVVALLTRLFIVVGAAIPLSACNTSSVGVTSSVTTEAQALNGGATRYKDLELVKDLPPPQNTKQGSEELVAVNDLLEIDVFQVDDLDRTVRVDAGGNISMSLIGRVKAAGRTIPDLEKEIAQRYATNYLQNPEVTVFMKESSGNRVTLDGEIRKPGIYPTTSTTTLLEAVALAGGFNEIADDQKLYVFREFGDKKLVANFNVREIRAGQKRDPRIYGGDVIVSFPSGSKVAINNLQTALGIAGRAAVFSAL